MDILNKTTFCSGPRLIPRRDFLLLNKVGSWAASFLTFTTIMGAVCGVVLLKKEIHVVQIVSSFAACIRPFSSVNPFMCTEESSLAKSHATTTRITGFTSM
jgi:hypothetical protein